MTHSPLPWIAGWGGAGPDQNGKIDENENLLIISPGNGGVAAMLLIKTGHAKTWPIVEANADLIITAVNLHAQLVAALEAHLDVLETLDGLDWGEEGRPVNWDELFENSEALLARSQEQEKRK